MPPGAPAGNKYNCAISRQRAAVLVLELQTYS